MSALGELIFVIFLGFLLIPPLLMIPRIIRNRKSPKLKGHLKWFLILLVPFIFFYGWDKISEMKEGLERAGIYKLTEYPNCPKCQLELKSTFRYEVRDDETIIESGKWKYRSGGDYWITYIGKYGQLGSGKYKYNQRQK